MSVICGFVWSGYHEHECQVLEHGDDWNEKHVCDCGASIGCREAARREELRKDAEANWRFYNPATDLLDIEELEPRMGETPSRERS